MKYFYRVASGFAIFSSIFVHFHTKETQSALLMALFGIIFAIWGLYNSD